MRSRTRPSRWFAVATCVAALAVGACGDDGDDGASSDTTRAGPAELVKVEFPDLTFPTNLSAVYQEIKAEGIDKKHGIDLSLRKYATTDEPQQALATGTIGISNFTLLNWAKLKNEGRDLELVTPLIVERTKLIVKADSPYRSLADLRGKKIGSLPAGTGLYQNWRIVSEGLGLDFEEDFEHVPGPPPAVVGFLDSGQVDAAVLFEPFVARLVSSGRYRQVMDAGEEWEKQHGSTMHNLFVAATPGWLAGHRDAAAGLKAMFREGLALASGKPDFFGQYQELLQIDDTAMDLAARNMATEVAPNEPDATIERDSRLVLEKAVELGFLTSAPIRVLAEV